MSKNLYRETFSHVRSSYDFNMEDFEKVRTKKTFPLRKTLLIAAAVAVLAALGITASATGFFGIGELVIQEKDEKYGDYITLQGYADSPESKAIRDHNYGGLTLEEAAEKYGITVQTRSEVLQYEELCELQGGDIFDARHEKWACYMYENGTFGMDGEFMLQDGKKLGYQLYRSVKGSVTDTALYLGALDDYTEWNIEVGERTADLVLGAEKCLVIADLGDSFVTVNVLAGTDGSTDVDGSVTVSQEQLEDFAKSFNWSVLSRIVEPEFPPPAPEVVYGAGVELLPEYIWEGQSFEEVMPGWGRINFITYRPTPEFDDVRFFLSRDGKISDYEFHPIFSGSSLKDVAAVSFEDLTGDGASDVLVLLDYVSPAGAAYREARIFRHVEGQEFEPAWDIMDDITADIPNDMLDVRAVREYCRERLEAGAMPDGEGVLKTVGFSVWSRREQRDIPMELDVIGKMGSDGPYDGCGVRELRIYDMTEPERGEPLQVIRLAEAVPDFVSGVIGEEYTDCWSMEESADMLDINFDGSPDIEVFGWITNNTIPHYYFLWRSEEGRFEYAMTLQGVTVDVEHRQVTAEYKSGPGGSEYTRDYYEPDENGDLVLVDTRKSEYGQYFRPLPDDSGKPSDYEGVLAALDSELGDEYPLRRYGLFDIDGNGTRELIVTMGTCEADFTARVYAIRDGDLTVPGEFGIGHSILYVVDGRLIRLMGHMGYELITEIGFDGEKITETDISRRELGPEDEYAAFETELETADIGDMYLLRGVDKYDGYYSILENAAEGAEYGVFDMDFDGTKELIASEGGVWSFWTAKDGEAVKIGELSSVKSSLHIYGDDHTLAVYYSNMSGGEISRVYKGAGGIVVSRVTGWEWKEGEAGEDPGPELEFYNAEKAQDMLRK